MFQLVSDKSFFCGFLPSNLTTPENIEEVKRNWNKNKLTYAISNLTQKLIEKSINEQIDFAGMYGLSIQN